jgi:hypothetical protein
MKTPRLMLMLAAALLLAGCGQEEESGSGTSTSGAPTTVTGEPAGERVCEATEFDVSYPAGWWVHERDPAHGIPGCALFHPQALTIEYNSEAPGIAIDLGVDGLWDEVRSVASDADVTSERRATVAGREAIRYELRSREDTIHPAGTPSTVWVVNLDPLGLVGTTADVGDLDYAGNQQVLDRMIESLKLPDAPGCSGAGEDAEVGSQDIPEAVAATRRAVAAAAAACDYAELDKLASPGFKSGFGGDTGPPSEFWRRAEAQGEEPMRFLVGMLDRPVRISPDASPTSYTWPSAFSYESWAAVPDADREALRPLYDDEDFEGFASFGGYIGWRTTIEESGAWVFYVAGD